VAWLNIHTMQPFHLVYTQRQLANSLAVHSTKKFITQNHSTANNVLQLLAAEAHIRRLCRNATAE